MSAPNNDPIPRPSMRRRAASLKPLVYTRQDACVLLACSIDKVDELIARGVLKTVMLGPKRVVITAPSIERVAAMGVEA